MKILIDYLKKSAFFVELRSLFRSFFEYRRVVPYINSRFLISSRIYRIRQVLDKQVLNQEYSIHFLCGHRDLRMLLWSLASWYKVVEESGQIFIHDDGTLVDSDKKKLNQLFPLANILDFQKMSRTILQQLAGKFPQTHHYRELSTFDRRYIFNIKLIDPFFAGSREVKLVLDSDLLWFKRPEELISDISGKSKLPVFMGGYGHMDFVFSDGSTLPEEIAGANSGVVCYKKEQFLLTDLEEFFSRVDNSTNPHFVEQAGYAFVLTRHNRPHYLPQEKYHIKGPISTETILKHYTSPRREQFWFEGVDYLKDKILDTNL